MEKLLFKKIKPSVRIVLEIVIAVMVAFLIEWGLNGFSLTDHNDVRMFENAGTIDENGKLVFVQEMETPVYVSKIKIKADILEKSSYKIYVTGLNAFDKTETTKISDKVYPEFEYAYTNIGKKITKIELIFNSPEKIHNIEVFYLEHMGINGFRFVFFSLIFFFILNLLCEKELYMYKLHVFYFVVALGFGSLIIIASGSRATTWDEEVHYNAVHTLNFQKNVAWNDAVSLSCTRSVPNVNTKEELNMLNDYMNSISYNNQMQLKGKSILSKGYIIYFPMVVAYHICDLLNVPFAWQYMIGRFGNLIFCIIINCIAIYIARKKKLLIVVLSLMPTLLFQSSLYTYDGIIFACMNLGVVLWINTLDCVNEDKKITWKQLLVITIMLGIGCLAKPVYFPIMILLIPLLWKMINNKVDGKAINKKRLLIIMLSVIAIICIGMLLVLTRHVIVNMLYGNAEYGGDIRGGDTGVAGQLVSIIKHPVSYVKLLVHEIFTLDNFRNFNKASKNHFLPSNLMFLNLYGLGMLKDAWSYILLPVLALLFITNIDEMQNTGETKKTNRLILIVAVGCSIILVWTAMYLAFSPIGDNKISGVQARYFLPLLLPTAYALSSNRIQIKISKQHYYQMVLGATLLLAGACFYQTLIMGRLM